MFREDEQYFETFRFREDASTQQQVNAAQILGSESMRESYEAISIYRVKNENEEQLVKSLSIVQEWPSIQKIQVIQQVKQDIPLAIIKISFPNLVGLNLIYCSISSIEFLVDLQAPHLRFLNLFSNLITSIRPLRKLNVPSLAFFCIGDNYLIDIAGLSELHAPTLSSLKFQTSHSDKTNVNILSTIPKIESEDSCFNANFCVSDLGTKNNSLIKAMFKKFNQVQWSPIDDT